MQPGARKWLVGGPPLAYLLLLFAAPLAIMALASFRAPGDFGGLAPLVTDGELNVSADAYATLFSDFLYLELFAKSLGYAALATLLCLAAGYPLALLIARSPRRHRDLLVLLVILPPLIYSAGVAMSWREFRFNLRPITLLAFGCVVFTTCAVATVAHYVLKFDWTVGFVLGAIVAPFFIMQPGMGLGIAASKTPKPNLARLRSAVTHTVFGVGLYLSALLTARWL